MLVPRSPVSRVIFRISCSLLGYAVMDPIVSAGETSEHAHAFFGANSVGTTIDLQNDFLPSVPSTCNQDQDKSFYWAPVLFQRSRSDGLLYPLPVHSVQYYIHTGAADMYSMPLGLSMLTGMGRARWLCKQPTDPLPGANPQGFGRAGQACRELQARLEFPTWCGPLPLPQQKKINGGLLSSTCSIMHDNNSDWRLER